MSYRGPTNPDEQDGHMAASHARSKANKAVSVVDPTRAKPYSVIPITEDEAGQRPIYLGIYCPGYVDRFPLSDRDKLQSLLNDAYQAGARDMLDHIKVNLPSVSWYSIQYQDQLSIFKAYRHLKINELARTMWRFIPGKPGYWEAV